MGNDYNEHECDEDNKDSNSFIDIDSADTCFIEEDSSDHFILDTFTITPVEPSPDRKLRHVYRYDDSMNQQYEYLNFPGAEDNKDESEFQSVSMKYDIGISKETRKCCPCLCQNEDDDILNEKPSNEKLLTVAFCTFMGFTILQSIAAYIAQSEAMMGDSAAMAVDAFTYAFNLIAERMKRKLKKASSQSEVTMVSGKTGDETSDEFTDDPKIKEIDERSRKKFNLYLEIIPPIVSVTTLIVVTIFVLKTAIETILLDEDRPISEQSEPNVILMFTFSTLNLLIDVTNVFCFAKAKRAFGYNTDVQNTWDDHIEPPGTANMTIDYKDDKSLKQSSKFYKGSRKTKQRGKYQHIISNEESFEEIDGIELVDKPNQNHSSEEKNNDGNPDDVDNDVNDSATDEEWAEREPNHLSEFAVHFEHEDDETNLNMCSAYTHVFADTIRSLAVIIASVLAKFHDHITPEEADATAAIVVSGVILLSLLPLFNGLKNASLQLYIIRKDEIAEKLAKEIKKDSNNN